jgi:TRAP-type C4-dicarboxylate transport system permease small subunit
MTRARRLLFDHFEELVAGGALVVVVAAVVWGVLTRYVTAQPANWAGEVAVIAFAWLTFFGAASGFRYGAHPTIDMLVRHLPGPLQTAVRLFNHLLIAGFLLFMTGYGAVFTYDAWDNPSPVLRLPLSFLYGPVTLGCLLMLVRYVGAVRHGVVPLGDQPVGPRV